MARDQVESLRPLLREWERGNFATTGGVLAPEVTLSAFVPGGGISTASGPAEIGVLLREFFQQWKRYRIEVGRLVELGGGDVLMEGRQHGEGRGSGIETADDLFILFRFEGGRVAEMFWHPRREAVLEAAGRGGATRPG